MEELEDPLEIKPVVSFGLSSGVYSVVRHSSSENEFSEEERALIDRALSMEEVQSDGDDDEEDDIIFVKTTAAEYQTPDGDDRKNWAEFGYDLDYVETPDEVLSHTSEGASSYRLGKGTATAESAENPVDNAAESIVDGLGQFLTNHQKSTDSTNTTKTPSSYAHSPIPTREIPPHVTIDDLPRDEGDAISDMWSGLGVDKPPPPDELNMPLQSETIKGDEDDRHHQQRHHSVPSDSSHSSEHQIKEHGSTICGVRTRIFILICGLIMLSALLVAGISVVVTMTADNRSNDSDGSDPLVSDTINIDDYVAPTRPGSETTATPPLEVTTTSATPPEATGTPTLSPTLLPTSMAPTMECQDRDEEQFQINGNTRNCIWLRRRTSLDFQASICEWNEPIRQACRTTCKTCDTFEPTSAPSLAPTIRRIATAVPTLAMTEGPTNAPSWAPTNAPTLAPSRDNTITTTTPSSSPSTLAPSRDTTTTAPTRIRTTTSPSSAPTRGTRTPTSGPTLFPTLAAATSVPTIFDCPPDLPGAVPDETFTCRWLAQTNTAYRTMQCMGGPAWDHCPETCGNCGVSA